MSAPDAMPSWIVPSPEIPNARVALERAIVGGARVRAAVAFVSEAGVAALAELLAGHDEVSLEVVARAADATSPEALLALRDGLDADVSVVIGRRASSFHPKLWLIEGADRLTVLSGSGNLTAAGLSGNDEQFEMTTIEAGGLDADAQAARFDRLTASALSLDSVVNTAIWIEWMNVIKQQRHHRREIERLAARLASRDPIPDRSADRAVLTDDLQALYDQTVMARLPTLSGRAYVPSRFKQAIDRVRQGADPVVLVTRICRHSSDGFDVLLANNRADLTVERLVLDPTKPYHDFFGTRTRDLSAERLTRFTTAAESPLSEAPVGEQRERRRRFTQPVTAKDIAAGQIRIPISDIKSLFPQAPAMLDVSLLGRQLNCRWSPRVGPDQERSGVIRVGTQVLSELLAPGQRLQVDIAEERIVFTRDPIRAS